jgi:hypothetical protein
MVETQVSIQAEPSAPPIPRQPHRVLNWPAYEAGLRQRGSLTVWFSDEAIKACAAKPCATRDRRPWGLPLAALASLTHVPGRFRAQHTASSTGGRSARKNQNADQPGHRQAHFGLLQHRDDLFHREPLQRGESPNPNWGKPPKNQHRNWTTSAVSSHLSVATRMAHTTHVELLARLCPIALRSRASLPINWRQRALNHPAGTTHRSDQTGGSDDADRDDVRRRPRRVRVLNRARREW